MATALRISAEAQDLEEDWDPQGLNSLDKEILESFGSSDDDEEEPIVTPPVTEDDGEIHSDDLDRDGLTELEEMERLLKSEESPLDFAMVAEDE
jgi:hypothetical protein